MYLQHDSDNWPELGRMPLPTVQPPKPARSNEDQGTILLFEIADARKRAETELYGEPIIKVTRKFKAPCRGCGQPLNTKTRGCKNCVARHSMRRRDDRRAATLSPAS